MGSRRYIKQGRIEEIAVQKYQSYGCGITFQDIMKEFSINKKSNAQRMLKFSHDKKVLFTGNDLMLEGIDLLPNRNPQQYFPSSIKADMVENLSKRKNVLVDPTGAMQRSYPLYPAKSPLSNCLEPLVFQTLEGYVLPLLPAAPSFIHNMHFKLKITPECYQELKLTPGHGNNGKQYLEPIGNTLVNYVFYPCGTVCVEAKCSRTPFKLETESDRLRLHLFFGQLMQALIIFLADRHGRIVPDITEWDLTECDINKDIKISHWLHYTGLKIQVKRVDHLFAVYITSMGRDTTCRVEERKHPNMPAIEAINQILNPNERIEKELSEIRDILARLSPHGHRQRRGA